MNYTLDQGSHTDFNPKSCCAMELAAHLAGLPHSDSPPCTSPVIAAYVRTLNDRMPSDVRNELLLPLIPQLLGTANADGQVAAFMCADRAVRVFAPLALDAAGLPDEATKLRELPEIVDKQTGDAADAYAAAGDAAASAYAAYAAAGDAADAYAYAYAADADAYAYAYAADAYAAARAAACAAAWPESVQLLKDLIGLSTP